MGITIVTGVRRRVPSTAGRRRSKHQNVFQVSDPAHLDDTVRHAISKATGNPDVIPHILILYITGTYYPRIHQSWCADCAASDPFVKAEYQSMKASYAAFLANPLSAPPSSTARLSKDRT